MPKVSRKKSYKGNIFKRKNSPFYWLQYTTPNAHGKIVRLSESLKTTSLMEAKVRAAEITAHLLLKTDAVKLEKVWRERISSTGEEADRLKAEKNRTLLVDAWIKFPYIERTRGSAKKALAPKQIETNRRFWELFVEWMVKHRPEAKFMEEITKEDAEAYSKWCRNIAKLTPRSCNKRAEICRVLFSLFLTSPAQINLMGQNPFATVRKWSEVNEGRDCLSIDELKRIIAASSGELRALIFIGLYTGMRMSDCLSLQWQDMVDGRLHKITRKTGKPISIRIHPTLQDELDKLVHPSSGKGPVLPELVARHERDSTFASRTIRKLFESVGVEVVEKLPDRKRVISRRGFHSLRATFISMAAKDNVPTQLISTWIGHSPQVDKLYQKFGNEDRDNRILAALAPMADLTSASPTIIDVEGRDLDALRNDIISRLKDADAETLDKIYNILTIF